VHPESLASADISRSRSCACVTDVRAGSPSPRRPLEAVRRFHPIPPAPVWESVTLWQKISVAFCSPSPWVMSVDVGVRDTFVKLVEAVIFSMGSTTGRARAVAAGAWQGG
jgi:hypothetical protein